MLVRGLGTRRLRGGAHSVCFDDRRELRLCHTVLPIAQIIMINLDDILNTYDHRSVKTGHPVRSAIHKH